MHKYLTAAGFSTLDTERKVYEFLEEQVIREENLTDRAALMEGCSLREYRLPSNSGYAGRHCRRAHN